MSAYATSFFLPPTSSAAGCQNGTSVKNAGGETSSCSPAESVPTSLPPLHLSDDEKSVSPPTTSDSNVQPAKSCMRSRVPEILISVKSASVDPAGFVRAITCRGGDGRKRPLLPRAVARPISNDEPKYTEASESGDQTHKPPISPKSDKQKLRFTDGNDDIGGNSHRHKSKSSSCSSSTSPLHSHPEDAIRFELSISYAGRKYSATRTLNRLVRLRQDLMREIEDRRPGIVVPKRSESANHCQRQNLTDDDTDVTASISFDSDQSPRNTPCASNRNTPPPVVVIPELPVAGDDGSATRLHKDHRGLPKPSTTIDGGTGAAAGSSLVSGSFTRLHMALVQYCPAVENWFHRILTDILPDPESSPSLIAFLWEPLGAGEDDVKSGRKISASITSGAGKHSKKGMGNKRHSSTRSICTLGSIDEQNCDEEDENDE